MLVTHTSLHRELELCYIAFSRIVCFDLRMLVWTVKLVKTHNLTITSSCAKLRSVVV